MLGIREKVFTIWVLRCWSGSPREVMDTSSQEVVKIRLDEALSNLL